jgi:hypothetical protein
VIPHIFKLSSLNKEKNRKKLLLLSETPLSPAGIFYAKEIK